MNRHQLALCDLIGASLFGRQPEISDDVDFNEILKEARDQAVVALVSVSVPENIRQSWRIPIMQSKAHFMRSLYEQTALVSLLKGANIPFVIIKGAAAAVYYPDPSVRTMGDVDFLVPEEYFDAAYSLLCDNGYLPKGDYGDGRDYSFFKGGILLELHKRFSDEDCDIDGYLLDGIKNATTLSVCGNDFPALSQAENGLLLLYHIRHHIFGGLGLRQIIDFMMFVCSEKDEDAFEKNVLPIFDKTGLSTLAKVVTKACKKYFGLPLNVEWCLSADDATCEEFIETVLSSGNFGRKERYEYRPMESFTMSVKKNGLFKTLQNAGVENCAAFKKHKWLRPFAWIYQSFRYLKRGVIAIFRKDKLIKDHAKGKEKADFYKRLGLF